MNIMGCPFCDPETIAKQKIFETENEYVFYNLGPRTKGQCLVVPKRHVESVRELDEAELASLLQTVKTVSTKLNDYLQPVAFNYGFNEGAMAGQTVPHLHFHIMPRYADDGIQEVHIFRNSSDEKRFMDWADAELLVGEFKKIF